MKSLTPIQFSLITTVTLSVFFCALCVLGCVILLPYMNLKGNPNSQPVEGFTVIMDMNQRRELFTQMEEFAEKNSLEFVLSLYGSDGEIFLVEIHGDGFHITAGGSPDSSNINVGLYNESSPPISRERIDELLDDLKVFIDEIPNVIIAEEK